MRATGALCVVVMALCATSGVNAAQFESITQVASGAAHTCALSNSGGVKCWGSNSSGQLGDGTTSDRKIPLEVLGLSTGVHAIVAGGVHSCASTATGSVLCWGLNDFGQLGDGTQQSRSIAIEVSGLAGNVRKIVAGGFHTCALLDTAALKCWGANGSGQLGDNTRSFSRVPVDVFGLAASVVDVAAGLNHTCALLSGGSVRCWGENTSGQLGDGGKTMRIAPVDVSGLGSGVAALAAGAGHTCALMSAGGVQCWGENFSGQLGDGTTISRLTPTQVIKLDGDVTAIAAGVSHTCVLVKASMKCWGENRFGQLGNPTTASALAPVDVSDFEASATAISAGANHNCVLTDTGRVECWGANASGQVGDGTTIDSLIPVEIIALRHGPSSITAGGAHTCSRMGVKIKCWGSNSNGQLGDGTTFDRLAPVEPSNLAEDITGIATGGSHTCALVGNGSIKCWGANSSGQLGDGTTIDRIAPLDSVSKIEDITAVATGGSHTCGLSRSGGVRCWGSNRNGQLGDGSTVDRPAPVDVTGLSAGIIAISAGTHHSCAINSKGIAVCWGSNVNGQLGDGTSVDSVTPVGVSDLGVNVNAIAAGGSHTCALTNKGAVACWGNNSAGQLGLGKAGGDQPTPIAVAGIDDEVIAITAGGSHTCALTVKGTVKCWGSNNFGQLGDGTSIARPAPVDVSGLDGEIVAIAAGENHTCALTSESGIRCWGLNGFGQLGDGTNADRFVPTVIAALTQRIELDSALTEIVYAGTIAINANATSGLPVVFDSLTTAACSVSGSSLVTALAPAGELCVIRAQQPGNGSFFPATAEVLALRVVPAAQTIIFASLPDRAVQSGEFELRATGGDSGFPVTFASQTPGVCKTGGTNGAAVTLIVAGTCTIRASQAGDNNFTQANDVDQSFKVTATQSDESNNDWWQWRGGGGCTLRPSSGFDWSFAALLLLGLGLRHRHRSSYVSRFR